MSRDLLLIVVALFAWGIGEGAFFSFQPLYLEKLGADPLAIGTILGATGIAMTFVHIPAGYLADRLGRRPLMRLAWANGFLGALVMALAGSLPVFIMGMLLYRLTAFVIAPLNSYITAARGRWSTGRALTFTSAVYNAGSVLGPLLGGLIGDTLGLRHGYTLAAVMFALSNAVFYAVQAQPVEEGTEKSGSRHLFQNRAYVLFLGVLVFSMFAMYLPQVLAPNFLENQRGLSLSQIGLLFSITSLGIVVLNLLLGQSAPLKGFLVGQAAVGAFTVLLWQGIGMPLYMLGFFLVGGHRSARSLAIAYTQELVSPEQMGLAYGFAETAGSLSIILAPPLAGVLYNQDPILVFPVGLGLVLVSMLVSAGYARTRPVLQPVTVEKELL